MGEFAQGLGVLLALVGFETGLFFLANGIAVMTNPTITYSIYQNSNNNTSPSNTNGIDPLFGNTTNCHKPGEPKHYTHIANLEFYLAVCMLGLMALIQLIRQAVDAVQDAEKLEIAADIQSTTQIANLAHEESIAARQALEAAEKAAADARADSDQRHAAFQEASRVLVPDAAAVAALEQDAVAAVKRLRDKEDFVISIKKFCDGAQNLYADALAKSNAAGVSKGIARLANPQRKVLRFFFLLANVLSGWCSLLGIWTFTDVIDYKLGCREAFKSPSVIVSLVILGIILVLLHVRLIFVAAKRN